MVHLIFLWLDQIGCILIVTCIWLIFCHLEKTIKLSAWLCGIAHGIQINPVLEACCYGACLQPTPRYCNESGEACRFLCHGNTRACKVLKDSGWEMNPPPSPKDLWHTGFACWLESRRPLATCTDVTLYSGQFMLSTQLITLKYPVMLSHWHSTKVFVENYPLYSSAPLRGCRQARRH